MGTLLKRLDPNDTDYVDRRFDGSREDYFAKISKSATLYIGNLSFFTTEDQVHELFSLVGQVQRIIMGLDRIQKTPCGFCFVIYHKRSDALEAIKYLNGTLLDNRLIRVDIDYGFVEGRQFGRGRSGGQVRDEFRLDYDEGRGGYGVQVKQMEMAADIHGLAGLGMDMAAPVFFGPGQRAGLQLAGAAVVAEMEGGEEEGAEMEQQQQVMQGKNPRFREEEEDDEDEEEEGGRRRRRRRVEGPEGEELELEVVQEEDGDAAGGEEAEDAAQGGDDADVGEEEGNGEEVEMGDGGAAAAATGEESIDDVAAEEDGT